MDNEQTKKLDDTSARPFIATCCNGLTTRQEAQEYEAGDSVAKPAYKQAGATHKASEVSSV